MTSKQQKFDFSIISKEKPKYIYLVLAENGTIQDYPLHKFLGQSVANLQGIVENDFYISKINQIILRKDGKQLEARMPLAEILQHVKEYIFLQF